MQRRSILTACALTFLLLLSLACGSSGTDESVEEEESTDGVEITAVTYGTAMENYQITTPVQQFAPADTVYVSIGLRGRPRSGVMTLRWELGAEVVNASVDLSDVNGSVLFSVGETTFIGGTLTHENPLWQGDFETIVLHGDVEIGRYPFHVGPPPGAISSVVREAQTSRGVTNEYRAIDPTTTFAPTDLVHLAGCGDFGQLTWLQAEWEVGGTINATGTRSLTLQENAADTCFSFDFRPENGWPSGAHVAILTMNDTEVGRYAFTVQP